MGNPAQTVGTGMPALVVPAPKLPPRRALLFDR
jgi:DNA-directed RNA polymerase III subunit RPC1